MKKGLVGAIFLFGSNLSQLVEFYMQLFGLNERVYNSEDHVGLDFGNAYVGFEQINPEPDQRDNRTSVWFNVEQIDSILEFAIELGGESVSEVQFLADSNEKICELIDPAGNQIGLIEKLSG